MPLMTLYSAAIIFLDLLSLQFKLILSLLHTLYRRINPPKLKSLKGENVLITGAGHGLGRELAIQLAEQGCRLALWDIDAATVAQTAKDIRTNGGRAVSYCCDIADRSQVLDTALKVKRELGIVGLVINNAGIVPIHPLLAYNPQQIRRVFDVNILSHFWILEAFLPDMITSNHGHIAAVGSMTGLVGSSNLVPYSASKFAVRGMMQALDEELREDARKLNVYTTIIHPFIVDTGQVQRPRLRIPTLLGVQKATHAARQIITAIRKNKKEASVPGWLLPLHDFARALPAETFSLLKDFLESGAEAHDPAWHGEDNPHNISALVAATAIPNKNNKLVSKLPQKGFGSHLNHHHFNLIGELGK